MLALVTAVLAAILAGIVITAFIRRIRMAHFSWTSNALALLGLPIFSYLLMRSRLAYKNGTVTWKGRTYGSKRGSGAAQGVTGVAFDRARL